MLVELHAQLMSNQFHITELVEENKRKSAIHCTT